MSLDSLFAPTTVAVVGASTDERKLGGKVFERLSRSGIQHLFGVNPQQAASDQHMWVTALSEVPTQIDVAVVATPNAAVWSVLQDCRDADVRYVVVLAEDIADGATPVEPERVRAFAHDHRMRILGPNSSGFRNHLRGLMVTFAGDVLNADATAPSDGHIGLVSQSGAMLAYLGGTLLRDGNAPLGFGIDVGNELDIDVAECIDYLCEQDAITTIGLVMETCKDWPSLRQALKKAAQHDKQVVALQTGVSARGKDVVASHTGAIAGSALAFDALFERLEHRVAHSDRDFVAQVAGSRLETPSPTVLVGTFSGGMAALAIDVLEGLGWAFPTLTEMVGGPELERFVNRVPYVKPSNPLDFGPPMLREPEDLTHVLDLAMHADPGALVLFTGHVTAMDGIGASIFDILCRRAPDFGRPIILVGKVPPSRKTRSVPSNLRLVETVADAAEVLGPPPYRITAPPAEVRTATLLEWSKCESLLSEFGVTVPKTTVCSDLDSLLAAAEDGPGPWVVKVDAPGLLHRQRAGLVAMDVPSAQAMPAAVRELEQAARRAGFHNYLWLLQEQIRAGVELFVGLETSDPFGPTAILSIGGSGVEAQPSRAVLPAPISEVEALEVLTDLVGAPEGFSVDAAATTVAAITAMGAGLVGSARTVEVNPIIVNSQGATAVDCVIVVDEEKGN